MQTQTEIIEKQNIQDPTKTKRPNVPTGNDDIEQKTLEPTVRDLLALDRTHLANERTMLAFMRTALYMVVTGLAIVNFYPDAQMSIILSWILFGIGGIIMILGVIRYFVTRKKILKHYK